MGFNSDEKNDNNGNRTGFYTPKKKKLIRNEDDNNSKETQAPDCKVWARISIKIRIFEAATYGPIWIHLQALQYKFKGREVSIGIYMSIK